MNDESKKIGNWYDWYTGEKLNGGYEQERWKKNKRTEFDYQTTKKTIIERVIPLIPLNANILEIGCGAGTWTKLILEQRPDVKITAVDISQQMIEAAKNNVNSNQVRYVVSDWLDFNTDKRFDFIFSVRAFEYFPKKLEALFLMNKFLDSGSYLAIITKQPHYWRSMLKLKKWKSMHKNMISAFRLTDIAKKAGFTKINIYLTTVAVPFVNSLSVLNKIFDYSEKVPYIIKSNVTESYLITMRK